MFKYDGTLLARERRDVLLQADWVPVPAGVPVRPLDHAGAACVLIFLRCRSLGASRRLQLA